MKRHPYDVAYAAGLFEGEGSVVIEKRRGGRTTPGLRLQIAMADLEPLQRIQATLGGTITGPAYRVGSKPMYRWRLSSILDVLRAIDALSPWLSPRRLARIEEMLRARADAIEGRAPGVAGRKPIHA